MNVLIACEESATVREAFRRRGHNAWSCDLLPSRVPERHVRGDVLALLDIIDFDLVIAHPPCTRLTVAAARWMAGDPEGVRRGVEFFMAFTRLSVRRWAIENPVGIMSTRYRKPDQIIQPWQFGHGETKATCLWLKNLPRLVPTNIVEGREQRIWKMPPGPNRARERSVTYAGIAEAMADQWGPLT